jgi:hypothetical protein
MDDPIADAVDRLDALMSIPTDDQTAVIRVRRWDEATDLLRNRLACDAARRATTRWAPPDPGLIDRLTHWAGGRR